MRRILEASVIVGITAATGVVGFHGLETICQNSAAHRLHQFDIDHDGKLTGVEIIDFSEGNEESAALLLDRADKNGDGITESEIRAYTREYIRREYLPTRTGN
jgi:hypothetical protein